MNSKVAGLLLMVSSLVFSAPVWADAGLRVFVIRHLDLKIVAFPWANELYLEVVGQAAPPLDGAALTVCICYQGIRAHWCRFTIKRQQDDKKRVDVIFNQRMGPLNAPAAEVLAGEYQVDVIFDLDAQSRNFQTKWPQFGLQGKEQRYHQEFYLGTPKQFAEEDQRLKKFYIERMRALNLCLEKMYRKGIQSLRHSQDPDIMLQGDFVPERWEQWLSSTLIKEIKQTNLLLKKHRQQVFFPRYSYTWRCLKEYLHIALTFARIYTQEIYRLHKVSGTHQSQRRKLFQARRQIYHYHQQVAQSLNIKDWDQLGYPRLLFY